MQDLDPILERCRRGDHLAWEALVRRTQSRVYGLALQYTKDASTRSFLESKITGLGGDVVATSMQQQAVRSPDYNTCDTAYMAGPVPPNFSLAMTIDYGEHDFVAFDQPGSFEENPPNRHPGGIGPVQNAI